MTATQIDKVRSYYDSTVIDYKTLWMSSKDLAMHFGYFDKDVKNHQESLVRMNSVLSKLVSISKNDRVLDAGCGYGGSAIWLAKEIGCEVVGLTVVPYQINRAEKFAEKHSLSAKVTFKQEDYARTSFPNNSFTVIWGLESIVHAESKENFIKEAYRLLKPGGRLLISEYMLRETPTLSKEEHKIIYPWLRGWAMPSLLTPEQYRSLLINAGFKNIKTYDLTKHTRPPLRRLEKLSKLGLPFAKLIYKLKLISTEHYGNIEASVAQSKALKMGLWGYIVITAEKG